jgi:hypothetical protein
MKDRWQVITSTPPQRFASAPPKALGDAHIVMLGFTEASHRGVKTVLGESGYGEGCDHTSAFARA